MPIYKSFFTIFLTIMIIHQMTAQTYEPALAYPMAEIIVDGNLEDWPKDMKTYSIGHLAFGEIIEKNDLKGTFRVGHNASKKVI